MQTKKRLKLNLSYCSGFIILFTFLSLQLHQQVLASFDSEKKDLEYEITQIFKDKADLKTEKTLTFEFQSNLTEAQKIEKLSKLRSRLYKIKYFNKVPRLVRILFKNDEEQSSFDYFNGEMTISLSSGDPNHPWVSLLSSRPLDEDNPEFITDQLFNHVDTLRFFPPESDGKNEKTEKSSLPFKPYSSSFLPINQGLILHSSGENKFSKFFKNKLNSTHERTSTLERFDTLRQNKLGYNSSLLTEEFKKKIYNPKAEFWEGHCNQWSAGALDRQVNQFIMNTQGLICDDIYLSQAELKELFTLFYSDYTPKFIAGDRTRSEATSTNLWIRNQIGLDDLTAHLFHFNIHRYLRRQKGLVIELSPKSDVWNQPVYFAKSTSIPTSETPQQIAKVATLIPAHLLESQDPHDLGLLEEYQSIENQIQNLEKGDSTLSSSKDSWTAKAAQISATLMNRPISELMKRRAEILFYNFLPAIKNGKLNLKKGVTAEYVTTEIEYGNETFFARDGYNSNSRQFNYLLFKKGDQILDGRWISPPEDRPDFLWVPENKRDSLIGAKEVAPEVEDLFHLAKYCRKASDVFSFLTLIKNAISDSTITEEEKNKIRNQYQDIAQIIDPTELKKLFKETKLRGVDVSDIFLTQD